MQRKRRNKGWEEPKDLPSVKEKVYIREDDISDALKLLGNLFPNYKDSFIISLHKEELLVNGDRDD